MTIEERPEAGADEGEWLSLSAASQALGVSASTLRRWAAEGRLVTRRTRGGHRRFEAQAVQRLAVGRLGEGWRAVAGPPAERPSWQARIPQGPQAEQMRGLGQRLLGLLIQYLVWRGDDSRFLADSRAVGADYGLVCRRIGISMGETVQAFLYFRSSVWRMALQLPSVAQATDAHEMVRIAERIDRFMDTVLLSTVTGYEQAGPQLTTASPTD